MLTPMRSALFQPPTSAAERRARASHDASWVQRLRHEPLPCFLEAWYRQAVFSDLDEQERRRLIARRRQQDGRRLARMLAATSLARQPDLRPWLKNNLAPLLYLSGERDGKFTALGRQLTAACPSLEHGVLAEAGDLVGKVLVDVSNPISEDFKDLVVGLTTSAAEETQAGLDFQQLVLAILAAALRDVTQLVTFALSLGISSFVNSLATSECRVSESLEPMRMCVWMS